MFSRFVSVCALASVVSLGMLAPAKAQLIDRVVAVVNDEAISYRDLAARVRLAIVSSNLPNTAEAQNRVVPQVLRKMVDERLQQQEADRLKISVSSADIDNAVAMIEQQNHIPAGALLAGLGAQGVDPARVRDQIKADLSWLRLTSRVIAPQIRIGDEEVKDRLQSLADRQGQQEVRAAEIFLPVDTPEQEAEARQLGEKLLEGLQNGTSFSNLARQFSRSPTSANGGMLGWVSPGMVDDEISAILAKLQNGQTSDLVRTANGFYIVTVLDTRIVGQSVNVEDSTVTIATMRLPVPPGAPPKRELLERAYLLTRPAHSCAEFDAIATKAGAPVPGRQGPIRIGELASDMKAAIAQLPPNQTGTPMDTSQGILVPMVCSRQDALVASPPTTEQVRRQIENERQDMLSRRYLRDLRRAAFIDVRM